MHTVRKMVLDKNGTLCHQGRLDAPSGPKLSKVQSVDQRMRLGMRCRLSPTADVPSHTSGAAMCHTTRLLQRSITKRCPHSGRPESPGGYLIAEVLGPSPEGEFPEDACRVFEGSSKANFLCLAMNADRLSDRFRQSSQISISVPNSTTCLAGTPKKVAEPLALCCRNAKRVSRQTAMPTTSSLGMIFSRPT